MIILDLNGVLDQFIQISTLQRQAETYADKQRRTNEKLEI